MRSVFCNATTEYSSALKQGVTSGVLVLGAPRKRKHKKKNRAPILLQRFSFHFYSPKIPPFPHNKMQRSTTEDQFNVQWDVLSDSHHGQLLDPLNELDHNEPAILPSQSVSIILFHLGL